MQIAPVAYPDIPWRGNPWPIEVNTSPKAHIVINTLPTKPITELPWQCPRCHYSGPRQIKAAKGKFFWEKFLMTDTGAIFFDCWTFRFLRKGIRDIAGTVLDKTIPAKAKWVEAVANWAIPKANFYEKACWDYVDIYQRLKKGQRIRILDWIQKKLVYYPISGTLCLMRDKEIFSAVAKNLSSSFTWFRAVRRTYDKYQQTKDPARTTKSGLAEFLKWTVGTEISDLGGDMGNLLSPKRGYRIGFLVGTLFSAILDTILEKTLNN